MALHYILDGYNVIKRTEPLADQNIDDGRTTLIRLIESFRPQGSLNNQVTVVFDGRPGRSLPPESPEVRVIFTYDESADDKIKRMVQDSSARRTMIVVTDDREIRFFVKSLGAQVLGSAEFLERLKPPRGVVRLKDDYEKISGEQEKMINQELSGIWLRKKTGDKKN